MNDLYPWYGQIETGRIAQGELIQACPQFQIDSASREVVENLYDVVVISQSCDLANDKLDIVQVCPY